MKSLCAATTAILLASVAATALAQRAVVGANVRPFVKIDTTVVALLHARVIDGTGASARTGQTLIIRDGNIAAVGNDGTVSVPAGAQVIDLTGKTVIPGIIGMHEHLFYPVGPSRSLTGESFTRLYLAGGVTSMRTSGSYTGFGDIRMAQDIAAGRKPGPWIDVTAPYLDQGGQSQAHTLVDAADAERFVNYWADMGATSFKAYTTISRAELAAAIAAAHKRGLKVTGHICSVTQREAAEMGIDDIEHAFYSISDFVPDKKPDECPRGNGGITNVDINGAGVQSLIAELVSHHVAYTSTLAVIETLIPGRPMPRGLDILDPILKENYEQAYARVNSTDSNAPGAGGRGGSERRELYPKLMAGELMFYRAGGLLMSGSDPTASGGVVPGFSNQRQFELLNEAGFTPAEAIKIMTLNGATYLGRANRVGSIAAGKQADLVVINGDPTTRPTDIEKVEIVFKQGIGYDPGKLIASVKGKAGLF